MSQYEPNDSRNVTLSPSSAPGEPTRTGHREEMAGRQEEQQSRKRMPESSDKEGGWHASEQQEQSGGAQASYGNSRDASGQMEQSAYAGSSSSEDGSSGQMEQSEGADSSESYIGETSPNPARRAKADASRPLSGS